MTPANFAAVIAATLFCAMAVFQIVLAAGAPLGQAAWGGRHAGKLPPALRIGSALAVPILLAMAAIVTGRAGLWGTPESSGVFRVGTWVIAGFLVLNTAGNLASASKWEKRIMTPLTVSLVILCVTVGLSAS